MFELECVHAHIWMALLPWYRIDTRTIPAEKCHIATRRLCHRLELWSEFRIPLSFHIFNFGRSSPKLWKSKTTKKSRKDFFSQVHWKNMHSSFLSNRKKTAWKLNFPSRERKLHSTKALLLLSLFEHIMPPAPHSPALGFELDFLSERVPRARGLFGWHCVDFHTSDSSSCFATKAILEARSAASLRQRAKGSRCQIMRCLASGH